MNKYYFNSWWHWQGSIIFLVDTLNFSVRGKNSAVLSKRCLCYSVSLDIPMKVRSGSQAISYYKSWPRPLQKVSPHNSTRQNTVGNKQKLPSNITVLASSQLKPEVIYNTAGWRHNHQSYGKGERAGDWCKQKEENTKPSLSLKIHVSRVSFCALSLYDFLHYLPLLYIS